MAGVVLAAMMLAGCGVQPGRSLMTFQRGGTQAPPLADVENSGWYALYPGNGLTPLDSVLLHKGDQFGFGMDNGKIAGVYVKNKHPGYIPLTGVLTSEYIWKYQGEK